MFHHESKNANFPGTMFLKVYLSLCFSFVPGWYKLTNNFYFIFTKMLTHKKAAVAALKYVFHYYNCHQ
jgi:hypothetical protein